MVVVAVGAVLPILMPQSRAMLWASALVVGVGTACLFASLIAQMQRHVQVTGSVWSVCGSVKYEDDYAKACAGGQM